MALSRIPTWRSQKRTHKDRLSLRGDRYADVVIVGGGLAGTLSAYLLAKEGVSVVVLEKDLVGAGASSYTTAFITQDIDTDLSDLVDMFGARATRHIWNSGGAAIDLMESIAHTETIDCEFMRCPAIIFTRSDKKKDQDALAKEVQLANRFGSPSQFHAHSDLPFPATAYVEEPNQAKFHPMKFLNGLASRAEAAGATIYEHSEVTRIGDERGIRVETSAGAVHAHDVIIATYGPFGNPIQTFLKKGMYVTYVMEIELPHGRLPELIFWDDENPYHYFRIDCPGGDAAHADRMILGGEDHRKEIKIDPEKNFRSLKQFADELLGATRYRITRKWRGPILEPSDGLPLIGAFKAHHYVATAFSGNGMTYSAITGMIMRDLIMGRPNPWAQIYRPRRIPGLYQLGKKARDYVGEFVGGALKNAFA